jgi:hypothetical protein
MSMSDPVRVMRTFIPLITTCDNKDVTVARTEFRISRGHSYEVPLPCYNFGSVSNLELLPLL